MRKNRFFRDQSEFAKKWSTDASARAATPTCQGSFSYVTEPTYWLWHLQGRRLVLWSAKTQLEPRNVVRRGRMSSKKIFGGRVVAGPPENARGRNLSRNTLRANAFPYRPPFAKNESFLCKTFIRNVKASAKKGIHKEGEFTEINVRKYLMLLHIF